LIVARYTSNGTLDTTFNGSGYSVFLPTGITFAAGRGVTLQSDGKIVVTGACTGTDGANDMLVARFNTNGTLDTSFGGGIGYVRLDGPGSASGEGGFDVAIQPADGKIVVVGTTSVAGGPSSVMVARFNVDGTPDATFAAGGYKIGAPPPNDSFGATGVALESDGSIIVAGSDNGHPLLMRFFPTSSNSLVAAGGAAPASSDTASLSSAQEHSLLRAGIARGGASGVNPSGLVSPDVRITNVPDPTLDLGSGNTIILDSNAADWGWLVSRSARRGRVPQAGLANPRL
jgi:uncharacterized delta-60 repeat protein